MKNISYIYRQIYKVSGLRARHLQVRVRIHFQRNEAFAAKKLTSMETCYSNREREAIGILYGLEKYHHYCFAHEVKMTQTTGAS